MAAMLPIPMRAGAHMRAFGGAVASGGWGVAAQSAQGSSGYVTPAVVGPPKRDGAERRHATCRPATRSRGGGGFRDGPEQRCP